MGPKLTVVLYAPRNFLWREHLVGAIARSAALLEARTTTHLGALAAYRQADYVVLGLSGSENRGASAAIETVQLRAPTARIVVCVLTWPRSGESVLRAVRSGCDLVLLNDERDCHRLRDLFPRRDTHREMRTLLEGHGLHNEAADMLGRIIARAGARLSVPMVAGWFSPSARTFLRQLERRGWPSPHKMIAWARVLAALTGMQTDGSAIVQPARGHFASLGEWERVASSLLSSETRPSELHFRSAVELLCLRYPALAAATRGSS